jgi:hypothetical protein
MAEHKPASYPARYAWHSAQLRRQIDQTSITHCPLVIGDKQTTRHAILHMLATYMPVGSEQRTR